MVYILPRTPARKPAKLYSLFEKINGRWVRITSTSYSNISTACMIYQERLIANARRGNHVSVMEFTV